MANPNIVNVSSIREQSSVRQYVRTVPNVLLENTVSSNEVLKINILSFSTGDAQIIMSGLKSRYGIT